MQYSYVHGYKISKLTLGTAALGMNYGISNKNGKPGFDQSINVLSCAYDYGINSIDTARTYNEAESIIGDFLSDQERKEYINLVTKFKISPENLFNKNNARAEVLRSVKCSLNALKLRTIPILLFHMDQHLPLHQVLEVLPGIFDDLKNEQLIDIGGVSVDHPSETQLFLEHSILEAFQVPVNIFDQELINKGILKRMKAEKRIVFVRSIFLQGLFFISPHELKGNLVNARQYVERLRELALTSGLSVHQLAFSYVRDIEGVTSMVFGAINEDQVKQNVNLLQGTPLTTEVKDSINSLFANIPDDIIRPKLWVF